MQGHLIPPLPRLGLGEHYCTHCSYWTGYWSWLAVESGRKVRKKGFMFQVKITGHLKRPISVSCHHHVATCRSGKHDQLYLHLIWSKIMCQECHMGWWFSTAEDNPVWGKWDEMKLFPFLGWAVIPALRGLACVHDCVSVSVLACASHTGLKSNFCRQFCRCLLFSAGLVAAPVSFNVRVHTTLKQQVRERQTPSAFP